MVEVTLKESARDNVIDKNASLADAARAAGDYTNTDRNLWCNAYLTVQFDTTAPVAGDKIGELYLLPGDGEATEVFPQGGDGTVGPDVTPQKIFLVGTFETISPSITVDEELSIPGIQLYAEGNRFVYLNTSGQIMDLTWQLDIRPGNLDIA